MIDKVFAAITNPALPPALGNAGTGAGGSVVGKFISGLVGLILLISAILALFYLVLGGIEWVGSQGEKTQLENARNKITHAITGLIIVAAAWAIMTLLGQFFGLDIQNLKVPSIGN